MHFSLIVATVNRVNELDRLLSSLERQTCQDLDVIVVDQNPDNRLRPLLQKYSRLSIEHLRSAKGLSRARNVALHVAKGDIISFPDDDCWYPDDLLATVAHWFERNPEFDVLFTATRMANEKLMVPKWAPSSGPCTRKSALYSVVSFTGFLRRAVVVAVGPFNEKIGVGSASVYQSGEDIDYYLRPLESGFRMWYESSLTVYHPEFQAIERLTARTYEYALGVGFVLRIHRFSWFDLSAVLMRSIAGAALNVCRGDGRRAYTYLRRAVGLLWGYVYGPDEVGKIPDPRALVPAESYKPPTGVDELRDR
jgi:glycosyltransferase involved in cell wall biosynthesis